MFADVSLFDRYRSSRRCATGGNRCAWFWYLVLILGGVAALSFWGVKNAECVSDASICANTFNLTQTAAPSPDIDIGTDALSARAFCEELFGSEITPVAPAGISPVESCITCVKQLQGCVEPTLPILYAGIALVLLTLVPCMFCCCCSNKPDPAEKYY